MRRKLIKNPCHPLGEELSDEPCSDNEYSERDKMSHWILSYRATPPLSLAQLLRNGELNLNGELWKVIVKKWLRVSCEATSTP
jgi:hypothetical protein